LPGSAICSHVDQQGVRRCTEPADLVEKATRWEYADAEYANGIKESFAIDHSMHSIFGASKVAADVMVQEYGRYFQMPTCFMNHFIQAPRAGEVYNLGGVRENSIPILEAFSLISQISGRKMLCEYIDQNRKGDHICYISDLGKMKNHYPKCDITRDLLATFTEIYQSWVQSKLMVGLNAFPRISFS
jgi:CDP-paratose 2-epimerase